jgi:adenylate kinase family enzyme
VGKTTLTMRLGESLNCQVFRLREYVPDTILAATATDAQRIGWIDDLTVARALRGYFERALGESVAHTVLLDNFPGSGTQVWLLLCILYQVAPGCAVSVVELQASHKVREHRMLGRRVCHQCEQDPIHDPRIPAQAAREDSERCARCGSLLQPRRGDAPRLFALRTQRYEDEAVGIRAACEVAGIEVLRIDSGRPLDALATEVVGLPAIRPSAL